MNEINEEIKWEIKDIKSKINYTTITNQLRDNISLLEEKIQQCTNKSDLEKLEKNLEKVNNKFYKILKNPEKYRTQLEDTIQQLEEALVYAYKGDSKYQFQVARSYNSFFSSASKEDKALYWAEKSAKQGNKKAMVLTGIFYIRGKGVAADIAQGISWYKKAIEAGHAGAPFSLGNLYYKGNLIKQSYKKAVYWYKRGNERKGKEVLYKLGAVYEFGQGHNIDYVESLYWYKKSLDQNHINASEAIKRVKTKMYYSKNEDTRDEMKDSIISTRISRKRDQGIVQYLKSLYSNACQVCGEKIDVGGGINASEVHHIRPLGKHNGPDIMENMIVLCPNHHVMFDRGAITINLENETVYHANSLDYIHGHSLILKHFINPEYIEYNDRHIYIGKLKKNYHNKTILPF